MVKSLAEKFIKDNDGYRLNNHDVYCIENIKVQEYTFKVAKDGNKYYASDVFDVNYYIYNTENSTWEAING